MFVNKVIDEWSSLVELNITEWMQQRQMFSVLRTWARKQEVWVRNAGHMESLVIIGENGRYVA